MTQRDCYLGFSNTSGTPAVNSTCKSVTPTFTTFPFKTYSGDNPNSAAYLLSADICATGVALTECVRLTAKPRIADAEVGDLKLSSTGEKTCTGTKADANGKSPVCWP
jgi:type IV pilus assembly protein PilE